MTEQARLDQQRTKVYRDQYRPTANLARFFKSVLLVLVEGQSPTTTSRRARKLR